VIFITFLISLSLVEVGYSARRAQYHAEPLRPSRLPQWLHRLVYRYRPYRYVAVDQNGKPVPLRRSSSNASDDGGGRGRGDSLGAGAGEYYHSRQRKLMKMEVQDAFEMRTTVLVVLGSAGLIVSCLVWCVATWVWGMLR
jgi:hypothetical protein